jgi:hypothetical protein
VPAFPQVVAAADASIALAFKNRKFFEIWHVLILGFERSFFQKSYCTGRSSQVIGSEQRPMLENQLST